MSIKTKTLRTLFFAALSLALLSPAMASAENKLETYKITVYNLTAGQPFTPMVVALHNKRADVFELGEYASDEVSAVAQNGNNEPLITALASNPDVIDYVVGEAPTVPANDPGATGFDSVATFTVTTDRRAKFVSMVGMLICTNDGFTGLDSVRLPSRSTTVLTRAYDARTESNTEDFADMVPPCQGLIGEMSDDIGTGESNPLIAETGVIIPHAGIVGGADLKRAVHDWADPVAKIVIERITGN